MIPSVTWSSASAWASWSAAVPKAMTKVRSKNSSSGVEARPLFVGVAADHPPYRVLQALRHGGESRDAGSTAAERQTAERRAWSTGCVRERDAELAVDVREVPLHRLDRHHELAGDLPVGEPVGGHPGDPALGDGQRGHRLGLHLARLLAEPVEEAAYPPLQRPQLLAARVVLGRAQQRQRPLRGVGGVGEQQQPGQVGVDLGREPIGRGRPPARRGRAAGAGSGRARRRPRPGCAAPPAMAYGEPPRRARSTCSRASSPAARALPLRRCARAAPARHGSRSMVGVRRELAGRQRSAATASSASPSAAQSSPWPGGPARPASPVPVEERGAAPRRAPSRSPGHRGPAGTRRAQPAGWPARRPAAARTSPGRGSTCSARSCSSPSLRAPARRARMALSSDGTRRHGNRLGSTASPRGGFAAIAPSGPVM